MVICIVGASGSGKTTIQNELASHFGYERVISYTTRSARPGEENGKDYYFITNEQFNEMLSLGLMAEYDEYSQGRQYGTLKTDYLDGDKVVVLTPNGLRQVRKSIDNKNIVVVYVTAPLGERIIRYIKRIGADKFTYDDKNEIASRVERDYAMFLGMDKEADITVWNEREEDLQNNIEDILRIVKERKNDNAWFKSLYSRCNELLW